MPGITARRPRCQESLARAPGGDGEVEGARRARRECDAREDRRAAARQRHRTAVPAVAVGVLHIQHVRTRGETPRLSVVLVAAIAAGARDGAVDIPRDLGAVVLGGERE
eukprot:7350835-Prymnesium_polylepis.1